MKSATASQEGSPAGQRAGRSRGRRTGARAGQRASNFAVHWMRPGLASRRVQRYLGPLEAAALVLLASACAGANPHHASGAGIWHGRAHPVVAADHRPAAPGARQPAHAARQPAHAAGQPAHGTTRSGAVIPAVPGPPTAGYTGPHFTTPQAAMRYLTAAYNSHDIADLHSVTDPGAFAALTAMRSEAANLHLVSCVPRKRGDYMCHFRHDYPASMRKSGHGASEFVVASARNPGWYMYFLQQCG